MNAEYLGLFCQLISLSEMDIIISIMDSDQASGYEQLRLKLKKQIREKSNTRKRKFRPKITDEQRAKEMKKGADRKRRKC